MPREELKYCATDKEIYDVLMASKQRFTADFLQEMAKDRGILYSPQESREELALRIALLPHDSESLGVILGQSESHNRAERVTSITLPTKVTTEEIKEVLNALREDPRPDEKVLTHAEGIENFVVQVQYSEIDYGKTRLLQRRKREANIRIEPGENKTTIRLPANPKAKSIAEDIRVRFEQKRKEEIPSEQIEIGDLSPFERTQFFTSLIRSLEGYALFTVTNVKVQSGVAYNGDAQIDETGEDVPDEEIAEAEEEMLAVVNNVALSGHSLLSSPEYQALREKGFYITSIKWVSGQTEAPFNRIEFEAGFEEPQEGQSFRYGIKGIFKRNASGDFPKTIRQLTDTYKQAIFPILERTARAVLAGLRAKKTASTQETGNGAAIP